MVYNDGTNSHHMSKDFLLKLKFNKFEIDNK